MPNPSELQRVIDEVADATQDQYRIIERNRERAMLIDKLSTARMLLIRANIYVEGVIKRDEAITKATLPDHVHPATAVRDEIQEFLATGIFGEVKS